jgi:hypothetical protein
MATCKKNADSTTQNHVNQWRRLGIPCCTNCTVVALYRTEAFNNFYIISNFLTDLHSPPDGEALSLYHYGFQLIFIQSEGRTGIARRRGGIPASWGPCVTIMET